MDERIRSFAVNPWSTFEIMCLVLIRRLRYSNYVSVDWSSVDTGLGAMFENHIESLRWMEGVGAS